MREISSRAITETVGELSLRAAVWLPPDLAMMLECASESETNELAASALRDIVENYHYAAREGLPICQDTGMAVVFADIGQDVHITGGAFEDAVNEGVRLGYSGLRGSVVADPLCRRVNTGDNTPAVLHTRIVPGDRLTLTVAPKGFGSENMSAVKLFLPSVPAEEVEDFIVGTVQAAGSNPCPPVVLGVGLGGTLEQAAILSKRALIRPFDTRHRDKFYAGMEERILCELNRLEIGAQGFGGRYTALAVNIETYPTHIAGLPCVVSVGCHATRHAETVL